MILKINRYTFNVTNKDWILDNGACYLCMTLRHREKVMLHYADVPTIMSKKQFKQLFKENKLIDCSKAFHKKYNRYTNCLIWKFNVGEE